MAKFLTNREENYSQWYNDLVIKADLAENSAVRGCMVIKPYGYAIWEKIQAELDRLLRQQVMLMHIFHFLFQNLFSARKQLMLRDLQKNVQL